MQAQRARRDTKVCADLAVEAQTVHGMRADLGICADAVTHHNGEPTASGQLFQLVDLAGDGWPAAWRRRGGGTPSGVYRPRTTESGSPTTNAPTTSPSITP